MTAQVVLLIEDELHMRHLLRVALRHNGFQLLESASGREGLQLARQSQPDLVLLDLGLPDLGGLELTQILRRTSEVPIVVLSARDAEEQKIAALDAGADDYVTKPFATGELFARIRAALRRTAKLRPEAPREPLRLGELMIDFEGRQVRLQGSWVHLTPTEYKLLAVLAQSLGRVVTHQQLLRDVWGPSSIEQVQYLRVYMKQLRRKIEPTPAAPRYLITEPAIGYRLCSPD